MKRNSCVHLRIFQISILFATIVIINNISNVYGEIFTHLSQCCTAGTRWAADKTHCKNYDYAIEEIPPVWHGLCLSTFGMCCEKELSNQHCIAGRKAARVGSKCEGIREFNSTFYMNCCKACQIGLAVSASGTNCSSTYFSYLNHDESYMICCNDISDDDNTFILAENDDICGKVQNLCSHICENTKDSYVCKCRNGYKLDDNQVTCSLIDEKVTTNGRGPDADDDDVDDDHVDNNDSDEEHEDNDNEECKRGFERNPRTNNCEDIDECLAGSSICRVDQYCYNVPGSYRCLNIRSTECDDGYRFNAKTEECEDINECVEELDDCREGEQICLNTRGSYKCQDKLRCSVGFYFDTDTRKCEDFNECLDNPCDEGYTCVNYPGNYECRRTITSAPVREKTQLSPYPAEPCGPGYRFRHNKCVDIDECLNDKNACDSNQICINEQGAYHCECKIGFKMDLMYNACVDVNECQINLADCLPTQRCDNTIGSYTCIRLQSCGTGYTLNAHTGNCDDDDECFLGTHDCPSGYTCRNTEGSFRCDRNKTRRLFTSSTTKRSVPTILTTSPKIIMTTTTKTTSPTTTPTTPTTTTTTTSTTPRSLLVSSIFTHSIIATPSTTPLTARTTSTTTTTTTTTTSRPTLPTYHVQQQSPYPPSPPSVYPNRYLNTSSSSSYDTYMSYPNRNNLDYYSTSTHRFRPDTYCGYGFQRNRMGACVDINECEVPGTCGSHQRCINTNGSYRCQNLLICPGGHKATPDGSTCVDIDECETEEHNCGPDQICRNKIGGYVCYCPPGHILSSGNRCVDINECEYQRDQVCSINSNCVNTIGSYYCECKPGFRKQNDKDKNCLDIDECSEQFRLCEQKCINFWGSYRCACNAGYELNSDNRTCSDINECEVHKSYNLCMGFCNNVPGSYECSCPPGYELGADKNSCRDIDECSMPNICSGRNEICTNIRGSYRCNTISCPYGYSLDPDHKNRCRLVNHICEGEECFNKPSAYTYNFITLVSKMLIPPQGRALFTLRGPAWYENIDFDLKIAQIIAPPDIEKATEQHFSTNKMHNQVQLSLMRSLEGPQDIELELSMTVFMNGQPRGKSVAKIFIIVSQYSF